jgi:hypothetical protein
MMANHTKNRFVGLVIVFALIAALLGALTPEAVAQGLWYGEYYANRDLAGGPTLTRYDEEINFDWGNGSPGEGIPSDNFSVRWTREEWFQGGTYRFSYRSDDGIRIWVGNLLVVDDWRDREAYWTQADRYIPEGTHTVRVEYYEHEGTASAEVVWFRITGGEGWTGEYFNNRELSGSPALIRYDAAVDFNWGYGSPGPNIPADNFSVRWRHELGFTPGTYRFNASTDDGIRVYVDGNLIIDAWYNQKLPNTHSADINLSADRHHILVEYYEAGGEASVHVWWSRLQNPGGWQGNYYDNAELRGGPALVRNDANISFDWGVGPPAPWMPADNFSARWTRQINFEPGNYRLNARTDDGVRVYVDDALVMDYWQPQDYAWNYYDNIYLSGLHTLKVEYYEGTGYARICFWWEPTAKTRSPDCPYSLTAPPPAPAPGPPTIPPSTLGFPGPWQAFYFNNVNLTGSPVVARTDQAINFNWGWGSPAPEVNADYFSARWDGSFYFNSGRFTFTTFSDDGVRLFLDGRPVINSWYPMRGYRSATVDVAAGTHAVRVEYFERTGTARVQASWKPVGGTQPTPTPTPEPRACEPGPLRLDAWPVDSACNPAGGWVATIFVEGHGGDCHYTYSWEGRVLGRPTPDSMTFEVDSATWGIAIVGEAAVTSAGQTAEVELHVRAPKCVW